MKFIFAVVFAAIAVTAAGVFAKTDAVSDPGVVGIRYTTFPGATVAD
jgi:hypothetical protein